MKKLYLLIGTIYNGTIVLANDYSLYTDIQTAEKVKNKLKSINGDVVSYIIKEVDFYETENDVPVLNAD